MTKWANGLRCLQFISLLLSCASFQSATVWFLCFVITEYKLILHNRSRNLFKSAYCCLKNISRFSGVHPQTMLLKPLSILPALGIHFSTVFIVIQGLCLPGYILCFMFQHTDDNSLHIHLYFNRPFSLYFPWCKVIDGKTGKWPQIS